MIRYNSSTFKNREEFYADRNNVGVDVVGVLGLRAGHEGKRRFAHLGASGGDLCDLGFDRGFRVRRIPMHDEKGYVFDADENELPDFRIESVGCAII